MLNRVFRHSVNIQFRTREEKGALVQSPCDENERLTHILKFGKKNVEIKLEREADATLTCTKKRTRLSGSYLHYDK